MKLLRDQTEMSQRGVPWEGALKFSISLWKSVPFCSCWFTLFLSFQRAWMVPMVMMMIDDKEDVNDDDDNDFLEVA